MTSRGISRRYLRAHRVDVTFRPGVRSPTSTTSLAAAIVAALEAAGAPAPASIGLVLTDDAEIAELNEAHLGHAGPTDVLSFPLLEPAAFPPHVGQDAAARAGSAERFVTPPGRRLHLGDIVVSVERATEQATSGRGGHDGDRRWSPVEELRLLVTHGALHVCGWDHARPAEEAAMRLLEHRLLT